jgi:hypothetical protein
MCALERSSIKAEMHGAHRGRVGKIGAKCHAMENATNHSTAKKSHQAAVVPRIIKPLKRATTNRPDSMTAASATAMIDVRRTSFKKPNPGIILVGLLSRKLRSEFYLASFVP